MPDDIRKKLEERLGLGSTTEHPVLPSGRDAAERLAQRAVQEEIHPLRVYLVFDTTYSMDSYIHAVRDCIEEVGTEILSEQKGIEAVVIGVGEHTERKIDNMFADHRQQTYDLERKRKLREAKAIKIGDYGQDNIPTTNVQSLQEQTNNIVIDEVGNCDTPEAYECFAADIARKINEDKLKHPGKKHLVVFFGDSYPHSPQNRGLLSDDFGCPQQRGPEQLRVLASLADRTYWVDCTANSLFSQDFAAHTFAHVKDISTATYVPFEEAREVLPEAIIAMVRQAEGPRAFAAYVAALPGEKASKIAGLLTSGKKEEEK